MMFSTDLNSFSKSSQRGLTMRCSERLRVSRAVLSSPDALTDSVSSSSVPQLGHGPRHAPPSLSLRSLGVCSVFPSMKPFRVTLSGSSAAVTHPSVSREGHWSAGQARRSAGRARWSAGQARWSAGQALWSAGQACWSAGQARWSAGRGVWIVFDPRPARLSRLFLHVSPESKQTPNHALQRTAPRVTARAFCERSASYIWASAVRATVGHAPRHAPPSLSLGSLGDFGTRILIRES